MYGTVRLFTTTSLSIVSFIIKKRCPECRDEKPSGDYYKNRSSNDGLDAYCIPCSKVKAREWKNANRELLRRADRERYWANIETVRAKRNAKRKSISKGDVVRATERSYRQSRKKHFRDYQRNWQKLNPESRRNWIARNRCKVNAWLQNRRARKRNAPGKFTMEDVDNLRSIQNGLCAYCLKPLVEKYDIDHIIPLKIGGSNFPTNLALACQGCNRSKQAKIILPIITKMCPVIGLINGE